MTFAEYESLAQFLRTTAGLTFSPDKAYLFESRLHPLIARNGMNNISELAAQVMGGRGKLGQQVIDAMTTTETYFFRGQSDFDLLKAYLKKILLGSQKTKEAVKILCAGSSSGQEPYSIAMEILEMGLLSDGLRFEIVGADINETMLSRSVTAQYSTFEVERGLPAHLLKKYFHKRNLTSWELNPEVRELVTFNKANLLHCLGHLGTFNIVVCRNVLIYFDPPTRERVLKNLVHVMADDSLLLLGATDASLGLKSHLIQHPEFKGAYVGPSPPPSNGRIGTSFGEK